MNTEQEQMSHFSKIIQQDQDRRWMVDGEGEYFYLEKKHGASQWVVNSTITFFVTEKPS